MSQHFGDDFVRCHVFDFGPNGANDSVMQYIRCDVLHVRSQNKITAAKEGYGTAHRQQMIVRRRGCSMHHYLFYDRQRVRSRVPVVLAYADIPTAELPFYITT